MGSGVSSLPETFTEEELQAACMTRCNDSYIQNAVFKEHTLYNSLKSEDGFVHRDRFESICSDSCEQEVLRLFLGFCNGNMDIAAFTKFCFHSKLLSKRRLTRQEAQNIFNIHRKGKQKINFLVFRNEVLPSIASKRGADVRDLIVRLARVEVPEFADTITTFATSISYDESDLSIMSSATRARLMAAVRIQSIHRSLTARQESEKRRALQRLESQPAVDHTGSSSSKGGSDIERKLMDALLSFSPLGEMTCREFLQFCHDTEIIPIGDVDKSKPCFTANQAKFIFQKTIAKYFDPARNCYEEGVLHGKRITFDVLREVTLVDVAEEKQMSLDELLLQVTAQHASGQLPRRRYGAEEGVAIVSQLSANVTTVG
jgi:hypothetical protein